MRKLTPVLLIVALQCGAADIPAIDTRLMEPQVRSLLEESVTALGNAVDSAQAWGKLGQLLHAHERFDTAVICYDEAMLIEPQNFLWPYLAGHAALTLRKADAIPYFEAASIIAPDNEALLVTHGNLLLQLGRDNDAQRVFRNALAINSESSAARVGLARIGLI